MFVVTNRVPVAEGHEAAFEERFRNRAGQIERNPGFVNMQILRPAKPGLPYLVQTTWESREAFERWVDSDDFRQAHADPMPKSAFNGPSAMEMHEVIISAGRPAR